MRAQEVHRCALLGRVSKRVFGSCVRMCTTGVCSCGSLGPEILKVPRLLLCGALGTPRRTPHVWARRAAVAVCFGVRGLTGLRRDGLRDCRVEVVRGY